MPFLAVFFAFTDPAEGVRTENHPLRDENSNPYAIFGVEAPSGDARTGRFVVESSNWEGPVARIEHRPARGTLTLFDSEGTAIGTEQLPPDRSAWFVPDPQSEVYYQTSPYAYCLDNPVNAIDPDGNRVIFVHGFLGFGSPLGGSAYWGGINSSFVRGAQSFFNDYHKPYFTEYDYSFIRSGNATRMMSGRQYAEQNYEDIVKGLEPGDPLYVVSHSMGGAFSEGMIDYLTEKGHNVRAVVHFNAWDPSNMNVSREGAITIDATVTNDWVQGLSLPINGIRDIPGAQFKIRKKSDKGIPYRHRELIDNGDIWNVNLETMINGGQSWNSAMKTIDGWVNSNPDIRVNIKR